MAAKNQEVVLALAHRNLLLALALLHVKENECSKWLNKLWQCREEQDHYTNWIKEMKLHDHSMHSKYFRILPFREPLLPALRLSIALRYLAIVESRRHFLKIIVLGYLLSARFSKNFQKKYGKY